MATGQFERLVNRRVTYTVEIDGQLYAVENVPARVNLETGEQFFSPDTVERIHRILAEKPRPVRTMETPVYDYAA